MKKIKFFCLVVVSTLFIASTGIAQTDFLSQSKMNSSSEFIENNYAKVKVVFRHHGSGNCVCPGCKCPGCKCPVGVCFCGGASRPQSLGAEDGLTQQDIEDGFGIAWVKIAGQQLHMIFETSNDENDILPVDTSPYADETDAQKFNSSRPFYITNGNYTVTKTKYYYGEVVLNITF